YIPFFTPMIMFLRIGMLDIAAWEIILSLSILVITIVLFSLLSARIYRGGVLMYGASQSFKDFKKALMLTKKE
ncbi:MAG TPA: ABC transporter permease, partial [Pseudogracilibacillus sp.]|nr:ABC transporter permease [Pseudogracilibacillus sp.]